MRDEAVASAFRRRDETVMAKVIDQYARLLWPIASAVLHGAGNEQDIEECVADTFIYLWTHPDQFDPARGSLKTLLCVLVRSRSIDRYREIRRRDCISLEDAVCSTGESVLDHMVRLENKEELIYAVNQLEEPNREILIRRYYHNQKPRQIALALGLTVKQVDNSLYRSKRQLRQILTGKGGAEG